MGGFEDDALLGDVFGDIDLELEARFAELEARADLADAHARADAATTHGAPPWRPADAPPAAAPGAPPSADDPLRDLKAAFTASPSAKPEADATAAPRELLLVLCPSPSCGRKNRLDRARAVDPASTPRCGACGTSLVTRK